MPAPRFDANTHIIVRGPGPAGSVSLRDIPLTGELTARLDLEANALSAKVREVTVSVRTVEEDHYPAEEHLPGGVTLPPQEISEWHVLRRSDGRTPVTANPGEVVLISLDIDGVSAIFDKVVGRLIVITDNWDPISIQIVFFGASMVVPGLDTINLKVRQGETVTSKMPVRWVSGPSSDVCCSMQYLGTVMDPAADSHSIEMISPLTNVAPGEAKDVTFSIQVGRECAVGLKEISASLVVYGMQSPSFSVNLNVEAAPIITPPTDYIERFGWDIVFVRQGNSFSVRRNSRLVAKASVPPEKLTEEQSRTALDKIGTEIKKFFSDNVDDIVSGRMTAAHIGGVLYGMATMIVLAVVAPPIGAGYANFTQFTGIDIGRNIGEFYGSIVDDIVAVVKREDRPTIYDAVGTMAAVYFTVVSPIVPGAGAARYLGADGWSFTKQVGKIVGRELEADVHAIESILSDVGDVIENVGDSFGDAVAWVGDIF